MYPSYRVSWKDIQFGFGEETTWLLGNQGEEGPQNPSGDIFCSFTDLKQKENKTREGRSTGGKKKAATGKFVMNESSSEMKGK